jgi:hypothetical protein
LGKLKNALNIFELWGYPIQIKNLGQYRWVLYSISALTLLSVYGFAVYTVIRQKSKQKIIFLGVFLICFFLLVLPVFADNFSGRQHLYLVPQIILITGVFATIKIVWGNRVQRNWQGSVALLILLIWNAFGATAGVQRALISPNRGYLEFIRTAAAAKQLHNRLNQQMDVLVININWQDASVCRFEPCSGFFIMGHQTPWFFAQRGFYEKALSNLGMNLRKLEILNPQSNKIDWKLYVDYLIIDSRRFALGYRNSKRQ